MANVDTAEIAKFEALASRWWDKNSEFKPLHDINPLRANYIDQRSPVAQRNVIDVGCGGGILAESLAQRGAQVTGIDMGEAPLSVARLHALEVGVTLHYERITAEEKAEQCAGEFDIDESFDVDVNSSTALRIPCFAHSVQLCVRDGLKAASKTVCNALSKAAKIVKRSHTSTKLASRFDQLKISIPAPCATRWNSQYDSVARLLEINTNDMNRALKECGFDHEILSASEFRFLFLRHSHNAVNFFRGDNHFDRIRQFAGAIRASDNTDAIDILSIY